MSDVCYFAEGSSLGLGCGLGEEGSTSLRTVESRLAWMDASLATNRKLVGEILLRRCNCSLDNFLRSIFPSDDDLEWD